MFFVDLKLFADAFWILCLRASCFKCNDGVLLGFAEVRREKKHRSEEVDLAIDEMVIHSALRPVVQSVHPAVPPQSLHLLPRNLPEISNQSRSSVLLVVAAPNR